MELRLERTTKFLGEKFSKLSVHNEPLFDNEPVKKLHQGFLLSVHLLGLLTVFTGLLYQYKVVAQACASLSVHRQ